MVGAIARTAIKKGAQYLAKRKAKKTVEKFFQTTEKRRLGESDPAKQTRKNKMQYNCWKST